MPVVGAVAAKGRAAGDVDDPPAAFLAKMPDGEAAKIGACLQVDGERPRPGGVPFLARGLDVDAFEDSGVVDEDVDRAELAKRRVPCLARRVGIGEIGGDQAVIALGGLTGNAMAGLAPVRRMFMGSG